MTTVEDGEDKKLVDIKRQRLVSGLLHPSTLLLLAGNAAPIYGVLYWGWDVFVLLILYWLETAIIGIWMIVSITTMPIQALGKIEVGGKPAEFKSATVRLFIAAFFVVHAGIFMTVHMVFLWALFSGPWTARIHGPVDFVTKLVVGTDMWIPLLVLFVVRGLGFVFRTWRPEFLQRIEARFGLRAAKAPAANFGETVGGFYSRIVVMHLTIIASGFVAFALGTITPLVIMVLIKTYADVMLQLKFDFGGLKKTSDTLTAVTTQ